MTRHIQLLAAVALARVSYRAHKAASALARDALTGERAYSVRILLGEVEYWVRGKGRRYLADVGITQALRETGR